MTSREAFLAAVDADDDNETMNHLFDAAMESAPALIKAADRGQLSRCRKLLKVEPVNQAEPVTGCTALVVSARNDHANIVRLLLKTRGVDVNLGDVMDRTALMTQRDTALLVLLSKDESHTIFELQWPVRAAHQQLLVGRAPCRCERQRPRCDACIHGHRCLLLLLGQRVMSHRPALLQVVPWSEERSPRTLVGGVCHRARGCL